MAQRKELEITIDKKGQVQVLVKCVKGQSCKDETKFLEDALGTVESCELTPEYYEALDGVSQAIGEVTERK